MMMQNQRRQVVDDPLPGMTSFLNSFDMVVSVLPDAVNQMSISQPQRPRMPPKPRPAPKPKSSPKARVLYDYTAGDNDEITLAEGEQVEVSLRILCPLFQLFFLDFERRPERLGYGS